MRFASIALLGLAAVCCKDNGGSPSKPVSDAGATEEPRTSLGRVAAIVVPNCAIAGCHDAVSKTHAMDLSTPQKIHDNWVNQRGFDHCTGMDTPRVIPGNAAESLVILKVEGVAVCAQSQRMPLPPRAALTSQQIAVIRAWIAEGAPSDDPAPPDAGAGDAGAVPDAGAPMDASAPADSGVPDDGTVPTCTATDPCSTGLTCSGDTCGGRWECLAHYDEFLKHPCAEELQLFCGCDGVTFEASVTCPDRPWLHVGACDDGVSCTKERVECADPAPECPVGQAPSVVGTCWGDCVPVESCRCLYHWMCPNLEVNTCLVDTFRCGPNPNLADGGMGAGP